MPRFILIGLRASGKTSVGKCLARLSHGRFVDLDDCVAAAAGACSAGDAFNALGERGFRALEEAALRATLAQDGLHVLALGGGTPIAPGAHELIAAARRDGWTVVLLDAPDAVLGERIRAAGTCRPSLTGAAPDAEVAAVRLARWSAFTPLADLAVDTSSASPEQLAHSIVSASV